MRRALDALYGAALFGACLAMVVIAGLVSLQVLGRIVDRVAGLLGMARPGLAVPSLAEFGGFLFVASAFLALPAALRAAGHVRVTLALRYFGPAGERALTVFVLLVAIGLALWGSWWIGLQTIASYRNGAVSFGLIPVPLWIPQTVMTAGMVIFVIALADELAAALRGGEPAFRQVEREREREAGGGGH